MSTTVNYRFVVKRDTAANFTAANTLLLSGEFAKETDTGRFKTGDGSTAWASLPYLSFGRSGVATLAASASILISQANSLFVVNMTATAQSVALPAAPSHGNEFEFVNIGANSFTLTSSSANIKLISGNSVSAVSSFTVSPYFTVNIVASNVSGTVTYYVTQNEASGALSAQIDGAFGNTQGSILYRDSASWQVLAPGVAGYILQTNGAAHNPSWVAPPSGGGGGGGSTIANGIYDISAGVPLISTGTQVNISGTAFISQNTGLGITVGQGATSRATIGLTGIHFSAPAVGSLVAILCVPTIPQVNNPYCGAAAGFLKSSTGNYATLDLYNLGSQTWYFETYSSINVRSGATALQANVLAGAFWFGLLNDGTNLHFMHSFDGANFYPDTTVTYSAAGFTGSPDRIFIGLSSAGGSTAANGVASFLCYDVNGLSRVVGPATGT